MDGALLLLEEPLDLLLQSCSTGQIEPAAEGQDRYIVGFGGGNFHDIYLRDVSLILFALLFILQSILIVTFRPLSSVRARSTEVA